MRKIILILLIVGAASFGIGFYFWNKPVASLEKAKADVTITAVELMDDYESDESQANTLYLGKIVEVTGTVKGVSGTGERTEVVLGTNSILGDISCNFDHAALAATDGEQYIERDVKIKGECSGYLGDVILERCVIVK